MLDGIDSYRQYNHLKYQPKSMEANIEKTEQSEKTEKEKLLEKREAERAMMDKLTKEAQ